MNPKSSAKISTACERARRALSTERVQLRAARSERRAATQQAVLRGRISTVHLAAAAWSPRSATSPLNK
jgi:hypothetical protein